MAWKFTPLDHEKQPMIRWGMPDPMDIYVVKEGELDVLEKGCGSIDRSMKVSQDAVYFHLFITRV